MPYGKQTSATAGKALTLFSDGRDGSFIYSLTNNRWEDGSGNALVTTADYTVVGATLTTLRTIRALNVTIALGATFKCGADLGYGECLLYVSGTLTVNGTLTAGQAGNKLPGNAVTRPLGAAAKATAGAGTGGQGGFRELLHGYGGVGGFGGGDGTNVGGAGVHNGTVVTNSLLHGFYTDTAGSQVAGTTVAGLAPALPPSIQDVVSTFSSSWLGLPSASGWGGGSGALKQIGGTNVGGAGGVGGNGKQPLAVSANVLALAATGIVHNDGAAGSAGSDGVATNAVGDISGGGGGGGGGSGGAIRFRYGSISDAGATWRSNGGTGGAGGLGYAYNATLRPTSNGGAGGVGTNGIIVKELA